MSELCCAECVVTLSSVHDWIPPAAPAVTTIDGTALCVTHARKYADNKTKQIKKREEETAAALRAFATRLQDVNTPE